ncbi:hypothetical protein TIFTF001_046213 [Ficus carica]|uniref:Uncharacterized protein n=1 Tax=Ficus carica TaxID=3494 RepID=A0AA87ZB72_FICCA|nr:hypothetical protein TIFTF001_046213 [Ficus carica]
MGGLASGSRTSERVLRNSGPGWSRQVGERLHQWPRNLGAWAERRLHVAHDPDSRWRCLGPKLRPGSTSGFSQDREGSASGPSGWFVRLTCDRFLPSPRNAGVRGPSGSTGRCHIVKHGVSCLVSAYVVGGVNHLVLI